MGRHREATLSRFTRMIRGFSKCEMIRYTVTATLASSEYLEEYLDWLGEGGGHIKARVAAFHPLLSTN